MNFLFYFFQLAGVEALINRQKQRRGRAAVGEEQGGASGMERGRQVSSGKRSLRLRLRRRLQSGSSPGLLPSAPAEQRADPRPRPPSSFLSREKRRREATARRGVTPGATLHLAESGREGRKSRGRFPSLNHQPPGSTNQRRSA